jgi:membrane-bound inhibitor of C-type lysozyme
MNRRMIIGFGAALSLAVLAVTSAPAPALTFQSYRCADGSRFIVGFFAYDRRAFMQIDGRAVTLNRRFALSGSRYSGAGIALAMTGAGTTVKHARRAAAPCELS